MKANTMLSLERFNSVRMFDTYEGQFKHLLEYTDCKIEIVVNKALKKISFSNIKNGEVQPSVTLEKNVLIAIAKLIKELKWKYE